VFDPFGDFATAGYLRNVAAEKDLEIVKRVEHDVFTANLQDAFDHLAAQPVITYGDFLKVHQILFGAFYPWAGRDRWETTPDSAILKGDTYFCHPAHSRLAVEEGLRLGQDRATMRGAHGTVMGFFAYGHPFLDGNGRTMLVVHAELCHRAGFSIDWARTSKNDYLRALSAEIATPAKGILDRYLHGFVESGRRREHWSAAIHAINGLNGASVEDEVGGSYADDAVSREFRDFDRRRNYELPAMPDSGD
jgi:cell filamentation protein